MKRKNFRRMVSVGLNGELSLLGRDRKLFCHFETTTLNLFLDPRDGGFNQSLSRNTTGYKWKPVTSILVRAQSLRLRFDPKH